MQITGIQEINSVWVGREVMEEHGLEPDYKGCCTEDFRLFSGSADSRSPRVLNFFEHSQQYMCILYIRIYKVNIHKLLICTNISILTHTYYK